MIGRTLAPLLLQLVSVVRTRWTAEWRPNFRARQPGGKVDRLFDRLLSSIRARPTAGNRENPAFLNRLRERTRRRCAGRHAFQTRRHVRRKAVFRSRHSPPRREAIDRTVVCATMKRTTRDQAVVTRMVLAGGGHTRAAVHAGQNTPAIEGRFPVRPIVCGPTTTSGAGCCTSRSEDSGPKMRIRRGIEAATSPSASGRWRKKKTASEGAMS